MFAFARRRVLGARASHQVCLRGRAAVAYRADADKARRRVANRRTDRTAGLRPADDSNDSDGLFRWTQAPASLLERLVGEHRSLLSWVRR
jgi:hypothetical protein